VKGGLAPALFTEVFDVVVDEESIVQDLGANRGVQRILDRCLERSSDCNAQAGAQQATGAPRVIPDDIGKVCDVSVANDLTYSRTLRLAMSPVLFEHCGNEVVRRAHDCCRKRPRAHETRTVKVPRPARVLACDEIAAVRPARCLSEMRRAIRDLPGVSTSHDPHIADLRSVPRLRARVRW